MLNKIHLLGRIGADPEARSLESGTTVTNFSLATTETWKDKSGEKQERTEWHRIEAWGKPGEIIMQYCKKGDLLYVEGSIRYEQYEKDGEKKYTTKIKLSEFKLMPKATNPNHDHSAPAANPAAQMPMDMTEDDLPF